MAQGLRALATLPTLAKDLPLVPTAGTSQQSPILDAEVLKAPGLHEHLHACSKHKRTQGHMHVNKHEQILKIKIK